MKIAWDSTVLFVKTHLSLRLKAECLFPSETATPNSTVCRTQHLNWPMIRADAAHVIKVCYPTIKDSRTHSGMLTLQISKDCHRPDLVASLPVQTAQLSLCTNYRSKVEIGYSTQVCSQFHNRDGLQPRHSTHHRWGTQRQIRPKCRSTQTKFPKEQSLLLAGVSLQDLILHFLVH